MASNLFFALRAVLSKSALQSGKATGTNLTAPNMFGLVTVTAFLLSIPVALIREGSGFSALWLAAMEQVESKSQFVRAIFISGLFHYLNNEVMYMALGRYVKSSSRHHTNIITFPIRSLAHSYFFPLLHLIEQRSSCNVSSR